MSLVRRLSKKGESADVPFIRLKNILPSGSVSFTEDENGKKNTILIAPGDEFEVTPEELERIQNSIGFQEGFLIFADSYKHYDTFTNSMSEKEISRLCDLSIQEFESELQKLNSSFIFNRVATFLKNNGKPSNYLEAVRVRQGDVAAAFKKSQEYETDTQRNARIYGKA